MDDGDTMMKRVASEDGRNPRKPGGGVFGLSIVASASDAKGGQSSTPEAVSSRPKSGAESFGRANPMCVNGLRSGNRVALLFATHGRGAGFRRPRGDGADDGGPMMERAESADGRKPLKSGGGVFGPRILASVADASGSPPPSPGSISSRPKSGTGVRWSVNPMSANGVRVEDRVVSVLATCGEGGESGAKSAPRFRRHRGDGDDEGGPMMKRAASADGRNPRKSGGGVFGPRILASVADASGSPPPSPGPVPSRLKFRAEHGRGTNPMCANGSRSGNRVASLLATQGWSAVIRRPRVDGAEDGIPMIKRAVSAGGGGPRKSDGIGVFVHSLTPPMADTPQISVLSSKFGGGEPPSRWGTINARLRRGPPNGARPGGIPWMPHTKIPAGRASAEPRNSSAPGNVTRQFRVDRQGPGMNSPVAGNSGPRVPFSARGRPESPFSHAPAVRSAAAAPGRSPGDGWRTPAAPKDSVRRTRAHDGEAPGFQRSDGSFRSMGRGSKRSGFPTTTTINPIKEDATHAVFS